MRACMMGIADLVSVNLSLTVKQKVIKYSYVIGLHVSFFLYDYLGLILEPGNASP